MEIFIKKLTKTDVKYRLGVPKGAPGPFQLAPGRFDAIGIPDNIVWSFEFAIRHNDPNLRAEIRNGWKNYVASKGLTEGDFIIFEREQREFGANIFSVRHVFNKPLKFDGEDILVCV